jgi:hypothetical protein
MSFQETLRDHSRTSIGLLDSHLKVVLKVKHKSVIGIPLVLDSKIQSNITGLNSDPAYNIDKKFP